MSFQEFFGPTLVSHNGEIQTDDAVKDKKLIGIYFSAHWCPPCRGFTPTLAEFYTEVQQIDPSALEIVFVSSDSDDHSFQEYFGDMPWLAVPFSSGKKAELGQKYGVRGIPSFIVVDSAGNTVDANGRSAVAGSKGDFAKVLKSWGVNN